MKKLRNIFLLASIPFLQSCEEKGVAIDFGPKEFLDSTYTASVETPQARKVFIEEFTGASCTNCPAGHTAVAGLIASNPERIVAVAYHTFNPGSIFKPVVELDGQSAYDFRDSAATLIGSDIYGGVGSIPKAGIDRVTVASSMLLDRNLWASETEKRLPIAPSANVSINSSYNDAENKVKLIIKVAYTKNVTTKNTLMVGVTESHIVDLQKYPDSVDHHYVHNEVFRKCLTPYKGNSVLDSLTTKTAGRVYEYNFSFTPNPSWKLENCHIIAVLSNNEADNKEVIQAAETSLK